MIEKYDYKGWINSQLKRDEMRTIIKEDSCIKRFSNFMCYETYKGDDTYGIVLTYHEEIKKSKCKNNKATDLYFYILVSQDGVKVLNSKKSYPIDVVQKIIDIVGAIKDSLNEFKFFTESALFWYDKPFTPDYRAPLWYHHNDKKPIKVENIEKYIKEKRLELELDQRTRENNDNGT